MELPTHQTATWIDKPGPNAQVYVRHDVDVPEPAEGEVLVKLEYTGVCHSDVHKVFGSTPLTTNIIGHEAVGVVIKLGPNVRNNFLKSRVGVKWLYSACMNCEICYVNYVVCPKQHNTGRDVPGTFQQYLVAPVAFLTMIPDGLKSEDAAPLLCAGLTIHSAIKKTGLKPGNWLVITGAGGGSGHYGVQIASKAGYKVLAIDSGEDKKRLCLELGATAFINYRTEGFVAAAIDMMGGYGAHAVIACPGNDVAYSQAMTMVRNLGVIVCLGLATGNLSISPFMLVSRSLTVIGSLVGTEEELIELLDMAANGEIKSIVELYEFEELGTVLQKLSEGLVTGRAVVRIP